MIDTYPNPWDFHNADKTLVSANNLHKLVYYHLKEIAMGAPIGGQCFLETADKKKIKIHEWSGGPPAWEKSGLLFAIPIWTQNFPKGTVQQIGIVDIKKMELKIFAKKFSALDIRSFDKKLIYGYDSPIHKKTLVTFDIETEKIDTVIKLTQ